MKRLVFFLFLAMLAGGSGWAEELLKGSNWGISLDKTQGSCRQLEDGSWEIVKGDDNGAVVFNFRGRNTPVTAGKNYEITWKVQLPVGQSANSMIYLPREPKARSPWPRGQVVRGTGEVVAVSHYLEVMDGEQSASLRLVLSGKAGTAIVKGLTVEEIGAPKTVEAPLMAAQELLVGNNWGVSSGRCTLLDDGSWELAKTDSNGVLVFASRGRLFPVVAGKTYDIKWKVKLAKGQKANSMIYLPKKPQERRPWPTGLVVEGTGAVVEVTHRLKVEEGESSASFRLVIGGAAGSSFVQGLSVAEVGEVPANAAEEKKSPVVQEKKASVSAGVPQNLLESRNWQVSKINAQGSGVQKEDGSWEIVKESEEGTLVFSSMGKNFPVTAGKSYDITWTVNLSEGQDANSMIYLPRQPKARSPWPSGPVFYGHGKPVEITQRLNVEEGEESASIRLVLRGKSGKAVVQGLTVTEVVVDAKAPRDLFAEYPEWRVLLDKSKGSTRRLEEGGWEVVKESEEGSVVFCVSNVPVEEGKTYLLRWELIAPPTMSVGSMVYLPREPKARSPWPTGDKVIGSGKLEVAEQLLTVEPGEKTARVQLVVSGKAGKVIVRSCTMQELDAEQLAAFQKRNEVQEKIFEGAVLNKAWKPVDAAGGGNSTESISFVSLGNGGGIQCNKLNWNADEVKMIEVQAAMEQPGYMQLDFTAELNGEKLTSYLSNSGAPTGTPQTFRFLVGENPSWRGNVKSLKIYWHAKAGRVDFQRVHALAEDNIIPFAFDQAAVRKLENLRPRGEYRLTNADGAVLVMFDQDNQELERVQGKNGAVSFTVPELMVRAELRDAAPGAKLQLVNLRPLELPTPYWRGKWIWSQNGMGPNNTTIWFEKRINLDALPEMAEAVVTADDKFDLFVNGTRVGGGDNWNFSRKMEIATDCWKVGENRVVAKIQNIGAWGGWIGELYLRAGGKDVFLSTDDSWKMHIGGDEMPVEMEKTPFVLGPPPAAPWGARMDYHYVGPKGRVRVLKSEGNHCELEVLSALPFSVDTLQFRIEGMENTVSGVVSPATGEWRAGETVDVEIRLPEQSFEEVRNVTLETEFLEVEDDLPLIAVAGAGKTAPPIVTARIVDAGGRPAFEIDGKLYSTVYYDGFHVPSKNWMLRDAVKGGCEVVRSAVKMDFLWPKKDVFDFSSVEKLMDVYSLYAPNVKVILQVNLGMPLWWCEENPDDALRYDRDQPTHPTQDRQALGSKKWIEDASVVLRKLIQHIKSSRYADRIFAIGVSEGWNSEWFWTYSDRFGQAALSGFSYADYATFRSYLKERYKTDEALAAAWGQPGTTFENFVMPTLKEVNSSHALEFQDVAQDKRVMDWFDFHNRANREAIEAFGKVVKEETDGKWLVGAYYGYFVMMSSIYKRLQSVGHLGFEELARSPYIDIFWAPSDYRKRSIGLSDGCMQAAEALTSHGKLVVVEEDIRTFSENDHYERGRMCTVEQTIGSMDRALGQALARGLGMHWMAMHDSWWREPVLLHEMKVQHEMLKRLPPPQGTTPVEVCIVSDQNSALFTRHNEGSNPHLAVVYQLLEKMNFVGIPYRHVMVKDLLEEGIVPHSHKLYIMTNLYALPQAQWDGLFARLRREKAQVLWLYAAGVSTETSGPDAALMSKTLGVEFRRVDEMQVPSMTLDASLGGGVVRNQITSGPWFYPTAGFEKVLATDAEGNPMLVSWTRDGVSHTFSVVMNPTVDLLRKFAELAGVHLYTPDGTDAVQIGNDVVFLIAKTNGRKRLILPNGCRARAIAGPIQGEFGAEPVWEAVSGRTYGFLVEK